MGEITDSPGKSKGGNINHDFSAVLQNTNKHYDLIIAKFKFFDGMYLF